MNRTEWSLAASDYRSRYMSAIPWPHLVLDGVFDEAVVRAAEAEEMPFATSLPAHKSYRQVKAESPEVSGPAAASILERLVSPEFVRFVSDLTGVESVVADPTFYRAGLHVGKPGSFQAVHSDFRKHGHTRFYHRINVLVYLNSDWQDSWGGHLELWGRGMRACGQRVAPLAGRTVIFETGPETYHGVPDPLTCHPDRFRLTLASYYYTEEPAPDDRGRPYLRRPCRPQDPWYTGIASPADAAGNALRKVRRISHHGRET